MHEVDWKVQESLRLENRKNQVLKQPGSPQQDQGPVCLSSQWERMDSSFPCYFSACAPSAPDESAEDRDSKGREGLWLAEVPSPGLSQEEVASDCIGGEVTPKGNGGAFSRKTGQWQEELALATGRTRSNRTREFALP